ncbi:penicillin-binding protein 1A [Noviherbaspirillum massiliense]|uniref:penicillin-binding protein 1A n=1 Tax=Noviherbaspirillum massiliense TaxID=1465823 RepID=UPI00031B86FE|nr:transglycosylase domain-containing protein [Noviherbaspirillum massiliense]
MANKNPEQDSHITPDKTRRRARTAPRRLTPLQHVRNTLIGLVLLIAAALIGFATYITWLEPSTPSVEDILNFRNAKPSILLSANGTLLATYSQGQQERVDLKYISPYVIKALLATEDHRFYDHQGIDIQRTLAAILHTAGGDAQGGSTITQQLVRNMFPEEIGRSRTIERKLREMITAVKIERTYTKDQILETYLNTVPFLYNVVGIEMAARTYYDKSAADLNLQESATLVGMLKGTSYYNPAINPERAKKRRNVVLAQMVKRNMLSEEEYQAVRNKPLQVRLTKQAEPLGIAPHFAAYLRRILLDWTAENGLNLYTDGLVIESTIDDRMQEAATEAVERQAMALQNIADVEWGQKAERVHSYTPSVYASLRKRVEPFQYFWDENPGLLDAFIRETPQYKKAVNARQTDASAMTKLKMNHQFMKRLRNAKTRLEAGFMAMDPATGEVKAWVGSRDFERDQFDHVGLAERQPGSTFKPIVYGAALEQGMHPYQTYFDKAVEIRAPDGSVWRPGDMSGPSGRMMSLREGLIYSRNSITAQVMQDVGLPSIIQLARAMGIRQSRLDAVPSLALGTSSVTLLEMVSTYSTIAQLGEYRQPVFIKRISDRNGKVLGEFSPAGARAMSRDTAVELIDMMRGVVRQGTGATVRNQFRLSADIAGKTGTTQNNTDGWFILMHPNLVAGAWVGFNDSRVTMRSDYWGQGGHNASLLVGDFFQSILKAKQINAKAKFPQPRHKPPLLVRAPDDVPDMPGYGVITRSDPDRTIVVGPQGRQAASHGDAVDDLARVLSGMGRNPVTAERMGGGSGDSGTLP